MNSKTLTSANIQLLLDKFAPLGRVPNVVDGVLSFSETTARKFILDSSFVKRLPRNSSLVQRRLYDTKFICFGAKEALSAIIQDDWELYSDLFKWIDEVDELASAYIESCEQAAIVISHSSFGDQLFPHIHQNGPLPTVSVFFNLTSSASSTLNLYPALQPTDKAAGRGYTDHRVLALALRDKSPTALNIPGDKPHMLVFDAPRTPHSYSYTDDLWFTFVYDQSVLKNSLKENHVLSFGQ